VKQVQCGVWITDPAGVRQIVLAPRDFLFLLGDILSVIIAAPKDGGTLAFVKVRTRTREGALSGFPELCVSTDKQRAVIRTALLFMGERHVGECPCRVDVLAIDNRPGMAPEVRLHKDAFRPQLRA
jgi:Holliday junction resolvase-like predicted endonuclease